MMPRLYPVAKMPKKIMFEIYEHKKKELSEYLKKNGFCPPCVETIEIHFHKNTGDISFIMPKLKF